VDQLAAAHVSVIMPVPKRACTERSTCGSPDDNASPARTGPAVSRTRSRAVADTPRSHQHRQRGSERPMRPSSGDPRRKLASTSTDSTDAQRGDEPSTLASTIRLGATCARGGTPAVSRTELARRHLQMCWQRPPARPATLDRSGQWFAGSAAGGARCRSPVPQPVVDSELVAPTASVREPLTA
jgi:hypothetical protein